jgi:hypothetical protein
MGMRNRRCVCGTRRDRLPHLVGLIKSGVTLGLIWTGISGSVTTSEIVEWAKSRGGPVIESAPCCLSALPPAGKPRARDS